MSTFDFVTLLQELLDGHDLSHAQMRFLMHQLMQGAWTDGQVAAVLCCLRMKGESVTEIQAAAEVMRELATPVPVALPNVVDTCGTGGDASGTFNISTASALVAAAAGVPVAKHGNRSVSSKTGSADVLEALGVHLILTPQQVAACVQDIGIGFMFAPQHHQAMKHVIGVRRVLGVRTLFNLLGPLSNPAGAKRQVLGVFDAAWLEPLAMVLRTLGSEHVLLLHAEDGMDEASLAADTQVVELHKGTIRAYHVAPEDFGLARLPDSRALQVDGASSSAAIIRAVLQGKKGPAADIVALNAGAAIYVGGQVASWSEGVQCAQVALADGQAEHKLNQLIERSVGYSV